MRRSLALYLQDMHQAAQAIQRFTAGKSLEAYMEDELLSSAVERKFSIIGEALAQIRHHFPGEADRVEHARQIIDFRNLLMHRYHEIDNKLVWGVTQGFLTPFQDQLHSWMSEIDQEPSD